MNGGRVTSENVTGFVAIDGYAARNEIEQLNRRRDIGLTDAPNAGCPYPVKSHCRTSLTRDPNGKPIRLEVNAARRQLFDDLAALILEGVGWTVMEQELYTRYGHARPNGKPYPSTYFYKLLHNPVVWGHSARYHIKRDKTHTGAHVWAYDSSAPVPDGVLFFPNTHPPLYEGDTAARIIDELKRRRLVGKGQSKPHTTHAFTGLLAVPECGYTLRSMGYSSGYPAYYCDTKRQAVLRDTDCSLTNYLPLARHSGVFYQSCYSRS